MSLSPSHLDQLRRACDARPGDLAARADLLVAVAGTADEEDVLRDTLFAFERAAAVTVSNTADPVAPVHATLLTRLSPGPLRNAILLHRASLQMQRLSARATTDAAPTIALVADAVSEIASDTASATAEQRLAAAEIAVSIGHGTAAEALLAGLSHDDPDVAAARALVALQMTDIEAAQQALAAALVNHPDHVRLLGLAALADSAVGDHEGAIARLERSLSVERRNLEAWLQLASCHVQAGRPALALGIIDGLADEFGPAPVLARVRADILEHLGTAS